MAELDETSRYALKLAPGENLQWIAASLDPDLEFGRWQDALTIAFPGEAERRCDTVAELESRSGLQPPWTPFLEVEANTGRMTVGRLVEHEGRLLRELRTGPHGRDVSPVAGVVLFLSGVRDDLTTGGRLPNTPWGGEKRYGAFCLEAREVSETLVRIERGDLGRTILLWIPLMEGADDPEVVAAWSRRIREEPSAARRAELAGLALVFASWRGLQELWGPTLEGFDVEQIDIVRRWKESA